MCECKSNQQSHHQFDSHLALGCVSPCRGIWFRQRIERVHSVPLPQVAQFDVQFTEEQTVAKRSHTDITYDFHH